MKPTLAIVGSGISGLATAYFLKDRYDITVFEKEDYFGGHTHTHQMTDDEGKTVFVDTGFVLFNDAFYPNFMELLSSINIDYKASRNSFALFKHQEKSTYKKETWWQVAETQFTDRDQYREALAVFLKAVEDHVETLSTKESIQTFVTERCHLPDTFLEKAVLPLLAAAWSRDTKHMSGYEAKPVLAYLKQHGFLGYDMPFSWLCIEGGYHQYVEQLMKVSGAEYLKSTPVKIIQDEGDSVTLTTHNQTYSFDKVVLACHSDMATSIIKDPSMIQKSTMADFPYHDNFGVLHSDARVMPDLDPSDWGALTFHEVEGKAYCMSSYLNDLQNLDTKTPYIFTLNPTIEIDPDKIHKHLKYRHISLDDQSYQAQKSFKTINTEGNIHFVGSYWRHAYHEDGVVSAKNLANLI